MRNVPPTFNKFMREICEANFPDFEFVTEPDYKIQDKRRIMVQYDGYKKTDTLGMWRAEAQFDVFVPEYGREEANRTSIAILQALELTNDRPGSKRHIPKYRYFDSEGNRLADPTQIVNSDILYYLEDGNIQIIYEPDFPELIHNTFSIDLFFKDDN